MRLPSALALALAACSALAGRPATAQMPFSPFGARQVALGGASVGLGPDATSFLSNPALLSPQAKSTAFVYGAYAIASNDFATLLDGVNGYDRDALADPASPDAEGVRASLAALATPGTSLLGDGSAALATVVGGFGIMVGTTSWYAAFGRTDLVHVLPGDDPATSFAFNDSVVAFRAMQLQDYAVSRAFPLFGGKLLLGVTGHVLRGTTGIKEEDAFTTDIGKLQTFVRRGSTGIERTRTRFSYDVGAAVRIGVLQLGAVMKGVNRPQFPFDDETAPPEDRGSSVVVGQQTRAGASVVIPGIRLRIAADVDLEKAETLAPGQLSRTVGGGLELPLGAFELRGGLSVNLEAPDEPNVTSFGFGYQTDKLSLDAAAVYRSHDGAYGAVLTLRVGL